MRKTTKDGTLRNDNPYDAHEHVHRFAAWAASTAASQAPHRFKVSVGKQIIESIGLRGLLAGPHELPKPSDMDARHEEWRNSAKKEAEERGYKFSDGIAAKLINVYLKAGLVTVANRDHERIGALHPPIDSVLLSTLATVDRDNERVTFWRNARWTRFTSEDYKKALTHIRAYLGEEKRLWMIERHFQGYID